MRVWVTTRVLPICSAAIGGSVEAANWIQLLLYRVSMNTEEGSWDLLTVFSLCLSVY